MAHLRGGSSSIESSSTAAGKAGCGREAFFSCSWRTLVRTACGVMPGTTGSWLLNACSAEERSLENEDLEKDLEKLGVVG